MKKIVIGYNQQGLDKKMDNANMSSATDETFKDINIRDNQINFFLIGFVSPLSSSSSVDFYKWYIRDTVTIDSKKYVQLDFYCSTPATSDFREIYLFRLTRRMP